MQEDCLAPGAWRIIQSSLSFKIEVSFLGEEVEGGAHKVLEKVRPEAEIMLAQLRDLMAKENDIIYERFRDEGALD